MITKIYKNFDEFKNRPETEKDYNGVSAKFAEKHPNYKTDNLSNNGCWECINCDNCSDSAHINNCTWCIRCSDCIDSRYLSDCVNMNKCSYCNDGVNCSGDHCNDCDNTTSPAYCYYPEEQ